MESKTIAVKLNQNSTIITVLPSSSANSKISITSLRAIAEITSLQSVSLPNLTLEDTETERIYKALDLEWKSPRIHLDLCLGVDNTWHKIGTVSLINQLGVPYRAYNLIPLLSNQESIEIGGNTSLGVQVADAGFGLLGVNDSVTIHGFYTQEESEITFSQSFSTPVGSTSQPVLLANPGRKYAIFTNDGNSKVFLNFGVEAFVNQGIPLLPGGSYELTKDIDYSGVISAISNGNTTLIGIEST